MEEHTRTMPKNASGLLSGWPEKTNRKLVAVVVVLLLLGVPTMSMALLRVDVERQTVEIEPWSHRAFHFGFFGFGDLEYSYAGVDGPEVYILKLDRISYYRFILAGESFDYEPYRKISPYGQGSASTGGFIWDTYLVLANNGPSTAYVEIEIDARAYLSLLPAAAILLIVSAAAYWMGRLEDKKVRLDLADPFVKARRPVRMKALKAMAALSVIPIATTFAAGAVLPYSWLMGAVQLYMLLMGVLASVILAFLLRLRLTWDPGTPQAVLRNLAYRLRASGYRVIEGEGRLDVQISSTSTVLITAKEELGGTWVLYKVGATLKGLGMLIVPLLFFWGAFLALPLALFMLYRTSVFVGTRVFPLLSQQAPISQAEEAGADTRKLIIESLSEGRRLSAEAYESAKSNYHDSLIIIGAVGLVLGAIVGILAYTQMDSSVGDAIALVAGIVSAAVFCAVSWWQVSSRSRPEISELNEWAVKLDAALSRETSGRSPSDTDPSAIETIADSLREMPKWLKVRRRGGTFRQPVFWILVFVLLLAAVDIGFAGLRMLVEGRLSSGAVLMAVCFALVLLGFLSNRVMKKRLDREDESTVSWWKQRDEGLRSEMEKLLAGE